MRQSIEDQRKYASVYPEYISRRMEDARRAETPEERSRCLADSAAAHGLYLRAAALGFFPEKPVMPATRKISDEIVRSKAFCELMANGGDRSFAESGDVNALVQSIKEKNDELNRGEQDMTAGDVIRTIQKKAGAWLATPRDYARLVAAYRLSSWREPVELNDGKVKKELRCDYQKRLDGGELNEETERVLEDKDFQYLMKHENKATLQLNAVNLFGVNFLHYAERAEKLREKESQRRRSVIEGENAERETEPDRTPETTDEPVV